MDVRGANAYKEHLIALESKSSRRTSRHASCQASRRQSLVGDSQLDLRSSGQVESILVCTGVYNPANDLLVHLRSLFNDTLIDSNNNQTEEGSKGESSDSNNNTLVKVESTANLLVTDYDKRELRDALSRKNSFISYFDHPLNNPDLTVDNLKDAVEYIVKSCNHTVNVE